MDNERILVPLDDLGIVRVQGPDATRFLQGQVSSDLTRLAPEHALLAGYHNPQGRTIALLRLMWLAAQDVIAVLPRELAPVVAARLAKFVLRAKVKVSDQSAAWRVTGLIGSESASEINAPADSASARVGNAPARWLIVGSPASLASSEVAAGARERWHRDDIASGQPQVFAATSEEFVAQMLNLDALDAISFDKGCYTGQEVIARAHYRGRVKRRLQRFATRAPCTLAPGNTGKLADDRPFKVVDAVQMDDGRCEFLAVVPLRSSEHSRAGGEPDSTHSLETADSLTIDAQELPLPYGLPD